MARREEEPMAQYGRPSQRWRHESGHESPDMVRGGDNGTKMNNESCGSVVMDNVKKAS